MIGANFDSTKTPLHDLLALAENGKLQLPDFQRGWVWDDDRIRSLLASVSVSFPIGAVMLLSAGRSAAAKIESATGKNIVREPALFHIGAAAEAYDEGPEGWDAEEPLEEASS